MAMLGIGLGIPWNNVIGGAGRAVVSFIINLLTASNTSTTGRTVWGYDSDAVIADGQTLLTVPALYPAITGGRLATTVADGANLGSEEITNGTFDTNITGWTDILDGVPSWDAGRLKLAPVTNLGGAYQSFTSVVGQVYTVSADYERGTAAAVRFLAGTTSTNGNLHDSGELTDASGTYTFTITATTTLTFITPLITLTGTAWFDNISTKAIIPVWYDTDADGASLVNSLSVANAGTNKCECVKANPTDTTGITKTGDVASVLSVVDDSAELALAGLDEVCNGNVYKLDNTSGVAFAAADISGVTGNANAHFVSAYVRAATGTGGIKTNTSAELLAISDSGYARYELAIPVPGTTAITRIYADASSVVYFILPQLEENTIATPVIIGADTAASATRDADIITTPTPSVLTAASGAIEMVVDPAAAISATSFLMAIYVDASNSTYIYASSSGASLIFAKRVGGVNNELTAFSYTPTGGTPLRFQLYWDSVLGRGLRVADASADIAAVAFTTDSEVDDTPIGSDMSIGHRAGILLFQGEYANNGLPICYASKEAAGW